MQCTTEIKDSQLQQSVQLKYKTVQCGVLLKGIAVHCTTEVKEKIQNEVQCTTKVQNIIHIEVQCTSEVKAIIPVKYSARLKYMKV